jgi:type IV pilus assembly protein PilW
MKSGIHMTLPTARVLRGFSLVELMVAMTLSLILMAGALSILYSTKLTSSENERVARVQEAGRTAFELIKQDTRAAGFTGCSRPYVDTSLQPPVSTFSSGLNSAALLWNFLQPVYGFEATNSTTWAPVLDAAIPAIPAATGGSDILVLRAARPGSPIFRVNASYAVDADIPVDRDASVPDLAPGTPIVISDCRGATVVLATNFVATGATAKISHAQSGAVPGNASGSLLRVYDKNSQIQPVQTVIYYIASCAAAGGACTAVSPNALWQIVGSGPPQELIQGVEAMQVQYGVDTDSDLLADQYVKANGVTNWNNVVSITIAILVRSIDQTGVETDKKTYSLLGTNFGPFNDRRQRSIFTTTIALRNSTS